MRRRIARLGSGITKNGDEFAGDEREIVSVLNVFKTSVDTINASSITSDMTIGANLNGGSLTLGAAGATVNVPRGTINASYFTMFSSVIGGKPTAWLDSIQSNLNTQLVLGYYNASEVFLGSPTTKNVYIGGKAGTLQIANDGLAAGARINIATGTNNVGNSQVTIGSSTLSTVLLNGVNVVMNDQTGSKVQIGGKDMGVMYLRGATVYINDGNNSDYINNGKFSFEIDNKDIGNKCAETNLIDTDNNKLWLCATNIGNQPIEK